MIVSGGQLFQRKSNYTEPAGDRNCRFVVPWLPTHGARCFSFVTPVLGRFYFCVGFNELQCLLLGQLGIASRTLCGASVGMVLLRLNPAVLSKAANSARVRSRPPVITIMFRSRSLLKQWASSSGTTTSTSNSLPFGLIARRQFLRIWIAGSSSQS